MPRKKHNTRKRKSSKTNQKMLSINMSLLLSDALKDIKNAKKIPFANIERPDVGTYKDFLGNFNKVIEVSERQDDGNFFVKIDDVMLGSNEVDAHGWYLRLTNMEYQKIHIQ